MRGVRRVGDIQDLDAIQACSHVRVPPGDVDGRSAIERGRPVVRDGAHVRGVRRVGDIQDLDAVIIVCSHVRVPPGDVDGVSAIERGRPVIRDGAHVRGVRRVGDIQDLDAVIIPACSHVRVPPGDVDGASVIERGCPSVRDGARVGGIARRLQEIARRQGQLLRRVGLAHAHVARRVDGQRGSAPRRQRQARRVAGAQVVAAGRRARVATQLPEGAAIQPAQRARVLGLLRLQGVGHRRDAPVRAEQVKADAVVTEPHPQVAGGAVKGVRAQGRHVCQRRVAQQHVEQAARDGQLHRVRRLPAAGRGGVVRPVGGIAGGVDHGELEVARAAVGGAVQRHLALVADHRGHLRRRQSRARLGGHRQAHQYPQHDDDCDPFVHFSTPFS